MISQLDLYPFMQVKDLKKGLVLAWRDLVLYLKRNKHSEHRRNAALTLTSTTVTTIVWDETISTSPELEYDSSTGEFTCVVEGTYLIQAAVTFDNNTSGARTVDIRIDDSVDTDKVIARDERDPPSGTRPHAGNIHRAINLKVGDVVYITAYQDSGSSLDLEANISGTITRNYCTISKL